MFVWTHTCRPMSVQVLILEYDTGHFKNRIATLSAKMAQLSIQRKVLTVGSSAEKKRCNVLYFHSITASDSAI